VDRVCVVVQKECSEPACIVLYQDKLGKNGFSKAVDDLNSAATLLEKKFHLPILCIVNTVDATNLTRHQMEFSFPYLLVRQPELNQFYGPVFAAAIEHVAERHKLMNANDDDIASEKEDPPVHNRREEMPIG
jgi:hypothetical protein